MRARVDPIGRPAYTPGSVRTWLLLCALSWLLARAAAAQVPPPRLVEPGAVLPPASAPPPVGACIGGSCGARVLLAPQDARAAPLLRARSAGRLPLSGAVVGALSAGFVLGGSLAIALASDVGSERVTRGVWLGYFALATPWVALSSYLGRKGAGFRGYRGLRRFGWTAYGLALTDGALLWYGAFHDYDSPRVLTIATGAIGAIALLAHALDALTSARASRTRQLSLGPSGLALRF